MRASAPASMVANAHPVARNRDQRLTGPRSHGWLIPSKRAVPRPRRAGRIHAGQVVSVHVAADTITIDLGPRTPSPSGGPPGPAPVYAVTSLTSAQATAQDLARLVRGHWCIEARHHVRDVSFGEDTATSRTGRGPANLATIRAAITAALEEAGYYLHIPEGRRDSTHPAEALRLHARRVRSRRRLRIKGASTAMAYVSAHPSRTA